MKNDSDTKEVLQMDPLEIEIFKLYRHMAADVPVKSRDDLPYSPEFDRLRSDFNSTSGEQYDHRQIWHLLRRVLKYGENHIEDYLRTKGILVPQKL